MPNTPKTSVSHPIRVDWLPTPWLGRVGLTFAPGKAQPHAVSGAWDRDLEADLLRLREEFDAVHLVCLLEDHEFAELAIDSLADSAAGAGIHFHRLPIRDGAVPRQDADASGLVSDIVQWAAAGENVVVHCKGGLGRAGTIGGCVLRAAGMDADATLAALIEARGSNCPETSAQRDYVRRFAPGLPSLPSRILGAVLGAAIGDALGHPTEFLSHDRIRAQFGPDGVSGFERWWERDGARFAP